MKNRKLGVVRFAVAWLTCCAAIALAQSNEGGIGEVSGYSGLSMGAMGSHPIFGGTTGLVASKYAIGLVDASFMPLGTRTVVPYLAPTKNSQFFDISFTVHVQIPVNHAVKPYFLLGPALLYNPYQILTTTTQGTVRFGGQNDCKFGFGIGGGARYYIKNDWGIRAEYRYVVSTQNYGRIVAGVFYQFSTPFMTTPFLHRNHKNRVPEL